MLTPLTRKMSWKIGCAMSKSTISTFELFRMFPDQESARVYFEARRWPDGATCPACGEAKRIGVRKGGFYRCNACLLDFTIRTTKDTKNGRARSVPVPERSAQFLAQWKAKNTGPVASLYVFHKSRGQRFKNFYRSFKTLTRRLGFGEVQWHDLRRTAGCRWLQDYGKSLHEVSVLLGHSSYAVTERSYAFLDQHRIATETAQFPAQSLR